VKEGEYGDRIWLMDFIYIYETELKKTSCNSFKWGGEGAKKER
jgi:hypothetical protein